jgi:hypothetical protein
MSQRECAGFNWPPLSIPAEEPVSISPEAVNRAGPQIAAAMARSCGEPLREISEMAPSSVRTFFSPSAARGVGHPANSTVLRLLSLFPAALLPFCAGVPAIGAGQPASATIWFSGRPVSQGLASFAPRLASIVVQVGQLARSTWWQSCTCPSPFRLPSFESTVLGVLHPASTATSFNGRLLCDKSLPAELAPL